MAEANYHFLSYVRSGFAASITQPDTLGAAQRAIASATVGMQVSANGQAGPPPITHAAAVRGPGDVIGLSTRQIVRTDPVAGASGFEPNYFVQIEFDRPDLPWMFTPAAAVGQVLRPWIVLVVLDAEGPDACIVGSGAPLSRVHVSAGAAAGLPDLAASHLWAHAQVLTPNGESIAAALAGDPRLSISRLLCPRHLKPKRRYVAAVVPAFNVGRLAGLGLPVSPQDEERLDPAWQVGAAVDLPVYHSWTLRTGEDADFESLARQLKGRPLPKGVGSRSLDVSRPGAGLPEQPIPTGVDDTRGIAWLGGALRAIDDDLRPPREPAATQAFQASITVLLDQPAALLHAGHVDPVIAPPLYGDKHALVVRLGSGTAPPWMSELNLDPANRVAAGIGTQVIQQRQEDLVARAWRQLGDVLAANRLLRAAQLARSGSLKLHNRLSTLDAPSIMSMAYPMQDRLLGVALDRVTLAKAVSRSRLPDIAIEPAFRRIARPSSAASRAAKASTLAPGIVQRFATEQFTPVNETLDGVTAMRPAVEVMGASRASDVLRMVGDAQPDAPQRLDTMIGTLAFEAQPFPTGDAVRAMSVRTDTGAVSMMQSLGAVRADVLSAMLVAAVPLPAAPTPQPPAPSPGTTRPSRTRPDTFDPSLTVRPAAQPATPLRNDALQPIRATIAAPAAAARDPADINRATLASSSLIFKSAGATRDIGTATRLEGGSVVIKDNVFERIKVQGGVVGQLDDIKWSTLETQAKVPARNVQADPSADVGSRLEVMRRDPVAMTALAQLAEGNLEAAVALDDRTASLATTGAASATLSGLAVGTFTPLFPVLQVQLFGADDGAAAREMVFATATAFDRMVNVGDVAAAPAAPEFDLAGARVALLKRLDPETTVSARLGSRLTRPIPIRPPRDELDPVMASPRFDDPMWRGVSELGSGWLLPGLEKVPPDTATLVKTNPPFVAAHMVGLNHEMMRELLWREYPTDQRGTPFHRFWGRTGPTPDDVGPVHGFSGALTDNLLAGKNGEAVLLVRSELLRRYPGSLIYLCQTVMVDGLEELDDTTIMAPSFRGDVPPDICFAGFAITPAALRDTTGRSWWFVIAQPPTEPRFGLDDSGPDTPANPRLPEELAWSHVADAPDGFAPIAPADPATLRGVSLGGVTWGASAAVQAHLTYQRPVRVAIRAAELLPPPSGGAIDA